MNAMTPSLASGPSSDSANSPSPSTPDAWRLGPQVPQTRGRLLRAVGLWLLTRTGWRFEGQWPNLPKFVTIVAPHTSNWDFPIGMAAKWAMGLDAHWWGKDSLFAPPLGWFMRANGGLPVDRKNSSKVVEKTIEEIREHAQFVLVLAPEGTRKKVTQWRSGFWHVAKGAGIPICCVAFDFPRKVIRVGPTTRPDEDDPADGIARIRRYYADVQGRHPSQQA